MDDLELPWVTSTTWILGTFALALVIFQLVLVRWIPLSKVAWKKVDYVWLSLAMLGIIGGVGAARQQIAINFISLAESRITFAEEQIKERLEFGRGPAICRTFVRSEFSPPPEEFNRIQREYDEQCNWFRTVSEKLQDTTFVKREILRLEDFGILPSGGDEWATSNLKDAAQWYNNALKAYKELSKARHRSNLEFTLTVVGPFLLAIALALRITKVTGEIRLERLSR